jgi:site-specific recombinase XerD
MRNAAKLPDLLEGFIRQVRINRAEQTCRTKRDALRHYLKYLKANRRPWRSAQKEDVERYLLNRTCGPEMKRDVLHAIRQFYAYLVEGKQARQNPAETIAVSMHGHRRIAYNIPSQVKVRRLFARLEKDRTRAGLRKLLLLELAYGSGLRRGELASLDIDDIDAGVGTAQVLGKGGRERTVPVTGKAIQALERYRNAIYSAAKPLFLNKYGRRLDLATLAVIFHDSFGYNTHSFRHACALHMLQNGCGIRHIQGILGHLSLSTTAIYTQLDNSDVRKMIDEKHPRRWWHDPPSLQLHTTLSNPEKGLLHTIVTVVKKRAARQGAALNEAGFSIRDIISHKYYCYSWVGDVLKRFVERGYLRRRKRLRAFQYSIVYEKIRGNRIKPWKQTDPGE